MNNDEKNNEIDDLVNAIDKKNNDCSHVWGGVISKNENMEEKNTILENDILENPLKERVLKNSNLENVVPSTKILGVIASQSQQETTIVAPPLKNRITEKSATIIVCASLIISILYSVCFSGVEIYPQVSFTLFCFSTFIILSFSLCKLKLIKNKKAFIYFIPICIIATFNSIFYISDFLYFNVIVMHILFGIFMIKACGNGKSNFLSLGYISNSIMIIIGNWIVFPNIIKSALPNDKNSKTISTIYKILFGLLLTAPIFLLILFLLMQADTIFNKLVYDLTENLFDFSFLSIITVVVVFIYMTGYFYNAHKIGESSPKDVTPAKVDNIIGSTFLVCINLLFLVFTIIQFAFLWGGGLMALPEGVIYSEYARQGFFQLLFVTFINFSVLIFFKIIAADSSKNNIIKFLLFMLCLFTGVLILSSFYRMNMYIDSYGYTRLRLSVLTFLFMEVFMIIATVISLFSKKLNMGNWYFYIGIFFFIIANITTSDYHVTKLNIERFYSDSTAELDFSIIEKDGLGQLIEIFESEEFKNKEIVVSGHQLYHANNIGEVVYIYEEGKLEEWKYSEYSDSDIMSFLQINLIYLNDNKNQHWQNKSLIKSMVYRNNQELFDKALEKYFVE